MELRLAVDALHCLNHSKLAVVVAIYVQFLLLATVNADGIAKSGIVEVQRWSKSDNDRCVSLRNGLEIILEPHVAWLGCYRHRRDSAQRSANLRNHCPLGRAVLATRIMFSLDAHAAVCLGKGERLLAASINFRHFLLEFNWLWKTDASVILATEHNHIGHYVVRSRLVPEPVADVRLVHKMIPLATGDAVILIFQLGIIIEAFLDTICPRICAQIALASHLMIHCLSIIHIVD